MAEYITYEQFGAIGDGKSDDMPAVVKAHEEANRLGLPVRAREGACYLIGPFARCAEIRTDTDWTGASFVLDDRDLDDYRMPVFDLPPEGEAVPFPLTSLRAGQDYIPNPSGAELFVRVYNDNHRDYIRLGANQDNGHSRTDAFLVNADGSLPSPVSFDFEEVTRSEARRIPEKKLTLRGGTFTTVANRWESRYDYHSRNIRIRRSNTAVEGITHYVEGEEDHGAPYAGFISISDCAKAEVRDCLFTAHRIYWTTGSAGVPVPMGSYDINCGASVSVSFRHCRQTTDIMDRNYWGLIGTNFCRDLLFDDCVFSRFDAHMGVTNCTILNSKLGWQCLNAIGFGTFRIENTEAYGHAFVNLRSDYGCTFRGRFDIRNCVWHPAGGGRSVFSAHNDGTHDFGYPCYLPQEIDIDGLTVDSHDGEDTGDIWLFNDWTGKPEGEVKYPMIPPVRACVKNVRGVKSVGLCQNPELLGGVEFSVGD